MRTAALWLLSALLHCGSVWSLDADLGLHQLTHRAYTAAEGASEHDRRDVAQTSDGMLWLGSTSGLARFDGQRFVRYPGPFDDPLPSLMVGALIAAPDGGLWIGYSYGGYSLLKGGRLTHFGLGTGGAVHQFAWDRDGALWAVTTGGGLQRFKGGVWEREASDSISNGRAVVVDAAGNLWVGTRDRILVRRRGEALFREAAKISSTYNPIHYLAASDDGSVWAAIADGAIARMDPPWNPRAAGKRIDLGPGVYYPLMFDDRGGLWIGGDPLRRIPRGVLVEEQNSGESRADAGQFNHVDGLTAGYVGYMFLDREHNVWVSTNTGVNRFSRSNVVRLSLPMCPGPGYALCRRRWRDALGWPCAARLIQPWASSPRFVTGRRRVGKMLRNSQPRSATRGVRSGSQDPRPSDIWKGAALSRRRCQSRPVGSMRRPSRVTDVGPCGWRCRSRKVCIALPTVSGLPSASCLPA